MSVTKLIKAIKGNYCVNEFGVIILGGLCFSSHFLFFLPLLILYFEFLQQFFGLCHVPLSEHLLHCLQRGYLKTNLKSYSPWLALYIHDNIHYLNQYGNIILHMIEHLLSVMLYIKTQLHWMMNARINIDGSIAGIFF